MHLACRGSLASLIGVWLSCRIAGAAEEASRSSGALVVPTEVSTHFACDPRAEPEPLATAEALTLARRIDTLIAAGIQDAGLEVEENAQTLPSTTTGCVGEQTLVGLASKRWVFHARLVAQDTSWIIRLEAVPPASRVLRVRIQPTQLDEIEVRTAHAVQDLVRSHLFDSAGGGSGESNPSPVIGQTVEQSRSSGRGVLAVTSAALGGGVGYSLQRASGSNDPRLTYPLIALGTAMGVGASMIVAEEWDIQPGGAWYLNAGATWPTASGLLLAWGYGVQPATDRFVYGMVGAASGMSLATVALAHREVTEGGALIAHSGGFFGTFVGALTEMAVRGKTDRVPKKGLGLGAGGGILIGGAAALVADAPSSRILFIDLSAGLGALTGAAVGSPLLFVEGQTLSMHRQRVWLASVGLGTLAGAGLGWYLTRDTTDKGSSSATSSPSVSPFLLPIPSFQRPSSTTWLVGLEGRW